MNRENSQCSSSVNLYIKRVPNLQKFEFLIFELLNVLTFKRKNFFIRMETFFLTVFVGIFEINHFSLWTNLEIYIRYLPLPYCSIFNIIFVSLEDKGYRKKFKVLVDEMSENEKLDKIIIAGEGESSKQFLRLPYGNVYNTAFVIFRKTLHYYWKCIQLHQIKSIKVWIRKKR